MSNKVYRIFLDKLSGAEANAFIGRYGDIFYDPATTELRISDGHTAGGHLISVGSTSNNWTNPNNNVWSIKQHSGGFAGTFDGTNPVLWFNKNSIAANLGVDGNNIRGAVIDYHAYMNGGGHYGTIIGTIHWANDFGGTDNVTHTENLSGNNNLSHDVFWGKAGWDGLVYKSDIDQTQNFWIQWTARIFIGSEFAC